MITTLSAVIITLFLLLPLCSCKRKAKLEKFAHKVRSRSLSIEKCELQQVELPHEKKITKPIVTFTKSSQNSSRKEMEITDGIQKQLTNLETAKSNKLDVRHTDETQYSQSNVEEVPENEKETFEANTSQKTSSHGTLEYVQPRVRFFERAKEIEHCEPVDRQRNEYRTLLLIDEDKDRITHSIYPREVRQQDITECKIEKYSVVGYQVPHILEENTCREDDF
ncbi:unnamed protein product [Litomosoides sigmodontis]|uniref:Uncharacterized protein n=1 Tax=Litomosoides sigmodontis TaxID=42156 RepID=A0A3P6SZ74_LITSI|nr:unnamed protein product [Litomosoides sigmodontis]